MVIVILTHHQERLEVETSRRLTPHTAQAFQVILNSELSHPPMAKFQVQMIPLVPVLGPLD